MFVPMSTPLPAFSAQVADAAYATLDMAPRPVAGLVVSCAGRERCLPGYRVARDGYACHAIEFVVEGSGTLRLGERKHGLSPGVLFSYGPDVPHVIETDARRPLVKYFVDFFGSDAVEACREAGLGPPGLVAVRETEATRRLFEELIREAQKPRPLRAGLALAYLRLLLLKSRERASPASPASGRAEETLQRALRLIEARHAELGSLAELAAAARVDPAHLCRLFARFRRDTPQRCLVRRKLDTAARLLATEPVMVKEAAAAVGFADPLHFSRVFHRAFACSPSAFQARHRASIALPRAASPRARLSPVSK
jgi:AraC-like DNA-binding protein